MENLITTVAEKFDASQMEMNALKTVLDFLHEFPEQLSWQGTNKPGVSTADGIETIATKFFKGRRDLRLPHPSTAADSAVGVVLTSAYGYAPKLLDEIIRNHQYAMLAENTVGNFLERYVASKIEMLEWCWCSGDLIKATDFIKKIGHDWQLLQIKNRNNSENSSSAAIRNNTTIQKWYRSIAQSGNTRWDKFPELSSNLKLSEEEFLDFIEHTIKKFKTQS